MEWSAAVGWGVGGVGRMGSGSSQNKVGWSGVGLVGMWWGWVVCVLWANIGWGASPHPDGADLHRQISCICRGVHDVAKRSGGRQHHVSLPDVGDK